MIDMNLVVQYVNAGDTLSEAALKASRADLRLPTPEQREATKRSARFTASESKGSYSAELTLRLQHRGMTFRDAQHAALAVKAAGGAGSALEAVVVLLAGEVPGDEVLERARKRAGHLRDLNALAHEQRNLHTALVHGAGRDVWTYRQRLAATPPTSWHDVLLWSAT